MRFSFEMSMSFLGLAIVPLHHEPTASFRYPVDVFSKYVNVKHAHEDAQTSVKYVPIRLVHVLFFFLIFV